MIELGKYNKLTVLKTVDFGIYMDGGEGLEILMPTKYVPEGTEVGDEIDCFVYQDAEARLLATTEHPYATVGQFAAVKVTAVNEVGAFADWGVSKQLLIPHREQKMRMEAGRQYVVYIYVDDISGRIVGTAKVDKYLDNTPPAYEPNEEVSALVYRQTPLGYKVIINNEHSGMVYNNQIFQRIYIGETLRAYVKGIREDEKIDLMLQPMGYRQMVDGVEAAILKALHLNEGHISLNDKSTPEEIAAVLKCSKKNFKKAAGALYKQGRINIADDGIYLNDVNDIED